MTTKGNTIKANKERDLDMPLTCKECVHLHKIGHQFWYCDSMNTLFAKQKKAYCFYKKEK